LEVVAKNTIGVITNVDRFVDEYMKTRAIYDLAEESSGDVFGKLKYLAQTETVEKDWQFDVLIIDEAQDFTEENFQFALHFLTPNSDIIVLKDNQQNVYSNGFDFKPTVSLRLDKNYRNAYEVIAFTDALLGKNYRKKADALTFDLTPAIEAYEGEQGYIAKLIQRIKEYLSLNFNIDDMVVIVGCGQKNSWLMKQHQIGPWKIKRFTGGYSEDGDQLYTEGELLVDTVYRFKGRQKPIVLFTEIDFIKWSDRIERLLYVGCTRAEISCSLFITEQAEQAILARSRQEQVQSVDA
jgi:superfamily I DNA and RNA helicase